MAKTILIIEDDNVILDMMTYILQDEGFHVISSLESVSQGYVLELSPALILMDDRLAAGFGRAYAGNWKSDPATRRLPVVLVSAIKDLAQVAGASGADAYLNKPFDLKELIAIVNQFGIR